MTGMRLEFLLKRLLWRAASLAALAIGLWSMPMAAIVAQTLPNHVDPSAREEAPDLAQVPAIRFLTTGDFPPFNFRDGVGELTGFNIDLARGICAVIEARCTIQTWPWEQVQQALSDNQGDALIAGLSIDEATAEKFDFSHVYLALPARFVTEKSGAGFRPEVMSRVAVRQGSVHADYLKTFFPWHEAVAFDTEFEALEAVANNEVNAYFGDAMRASFWLNDHPDCCAFAGDPYFDRAYFGPGLTIAVRAGQDSVRAAINWALARLKRDGSLDGYYLKWFPVGFY